MRKLTSTVLLGISICFAFIPAALADEITTPASYTVSQGDTLSSIALKSQTTVAKLIQLNQLTDPNKLQIGQKLLLTSPPASAPAAAQPAAPAAKEYVVKASDTLSLIAHQTGTAISQIVAANKLADPSKLFIGQVLIIPAPQPAALASRSDDRRSASAEDQAALLLEYARSLRGKPYSYGAVGPNSYDCSGFTMKAFKQIGISLPHSSAQQSTMGKSISKSDLLPGDLVFFNTSGSGVSHVGIYVGSGSFIHASTTQGVTITSLGSTYYAKRYLKARRII